MPDPGLPAIAAAWEELRPLLLRGPCRGCECLHGVLVALRLALEDLPPGPEQAALLASLRAAVRPADLHSCLGCQPCAPGDILARQGAPASSSGTSTRPPSATSSSSD
jgi:hypothetical protein